MALLVSTCGFLEAARTVLATSLPRGHAQVYPRRVSSSSPLPSLRRAGDMGAGDSPRQAWEAASSDFASSIPERRQRLLLCPAWGVQMCAEPPVPGEHQELSSFTQRKE